MNSSFGERFDHSPYGFVFNGRAGAPFLHVLPRHDLQHGIVIEIANEQINFAIGAVFLSDRLHSMVSVCDLGAAVHLTRDDVSPISGRA